MSELKNEITKVLEKDPTIMAKLKSVLLKFAENVVTPVEPIVVAAPVVLAANTSDLKDGSQITYEGTLDVGVAVMKDGVAAVDGDYELMDGTKITITNGVVASISSVEPAEPAATETETLLPQMQQAFKAMELKLSAQVTEKESLKAELSEVKEALKTTLLAFKTIIEAPVVESGVVNNKKSYDEMTNHEKMLYNKGKL